MDNIKGYFELLNDHYSHLLAKEVILAYDGDVTHQIMKAFTQLVEEKLENENEDETIRRRLYHVLVECLQNINRHAEVFYTDDRDYYPGRGAMLVSKSKTHYRVITANLVLEKYVNNIKKFLEEINPLSVQELNDKYKQQLMEGKL
nr:SiaB family protein kinase [Bacteroidales bacterium]